jgi:tetratricopeptide (TPR) repeat protein
MVAPGRAANIPEFVALAPDSIVKVHEQFLDDGSYTRAGNEFYRQGDSDRAIEKYKTALSLNPNNVMAHQRLGFLLYNTKNQANEAMEHMQAAVQLDPRNAFAQFDLGTALRNQGDLSNAVVHLQEALRLLPGGYDAVYNATDMNFTLAEAYFGLSLYPESILAFEEVLRRNANHAEANYMMALAKAWLGETDATLPYYETAIRSEPQLSRQPDYYDLLSRNYLSQGLYEEGLKASEKAARLAVEAGRSQQAAKLQQRAEECRRRGATGKS